MEQFEHVQAWGEGDELHRKIYSFADRLPKHFFREFRAGKGACHTKTYFGEGQPAKFFQLFGRAARNLNGHVKAAVGGEPAQNGAAK
ncbi:MAG: hypothetical protein PVS2B2_20940 [Candidatus Acidiferrum sp.]